MTKSEQFKLKKANAKARRAAGQKRRRRPGPENVWRCPGTHPWPPTLAPGMSALGLLAATAALTHDDQSRQTVTVGELIRLAGGLCSVHGENSEYDRALAEPISDAAGPSIGESRDEVLRRIQEASPERRLGNQHARLE